MILSLRKYASLKGCSEGNVRAAIKSGKIKQGVVREGDKVKGIDVDVADREWSSNYNTDRVRNQSVFESVVSNKKVEPKKQEKTKIDKQNLKINSQQVSNASAENNEVKDQNNITSEMSIADAKRAEAILKAKKLQIEIEEMQGRLIDADKVKKSLYEFGSQVRERLLMVPDLVVDRVMAARNRNEGHILLTVEITSALESLSKNNR